MIFEFWRVKMELACFPTILGRGEIHSRGTWGSIFDRKIPCPSKRMFFNMDTEAL